VRLVCDTAALRSATQAISFCLAVSLNLLGLQPLQAESPSPGASPAAPDPATGEVRLPAANGWNAFLILDNKGVPLWTVEPADIFESHGCPEVVGLDDKGHAHICVSYSGRWTPTTLIADPKWLGGFAHGDIDPRIAGAEAYVGAQSGNLYQIVAWPNLVLDYRLIASLPGREIHTLAAGQLDPTTPEPEVVAFTVPGGVFQISPTGANGTFQWKHLGDYVGRVRQALVLPLAPNESPSIVTASRNGRLELLQIAGGQMKWRTIYETEMGMGRVALRPAQPGQPLTLYSTLDDGRILRHEQRGATNWQTEVIYHGPQGPRGVAAGQFDADPNVETVVIFGYGKKVERLARRADRWQAETIFEDFEKGHWIAAAELDGRNSTREIVVTGYGGRIYYLARPPGYGRPELAMRADAAKENFEGCDVGTLPAGWTSAITGEGAPAWAVAGDSTASSGAKVLQQSAVTPKPSFPLCLAGAPELKDGFVEVKFKTVSGTNDQAGGVVWRARDAANYYVCRANALEDNVVLYKVENGKRTALDIVGRAGGYGVTAKVEPARWHTLRVEFAGTQFRVALDGAELFTVADTTFPGAGKVGVWTKADSVTLFDDFRCGSQ
jgi:hypothetical protein